jgi:hypothetical protein
MSTFDDMTKEIFDMAKKAQASREANAPIAQASADWNAKLNRIAEKEKLDATIKANERNYDKTMAIEQARSDRQDSINQRYLDVQNLRNEGGTGGGSGSGSGTRKDGKLTDAKMAELAIEHSKANPGLPGKPDTGISFDQAYDKLKKRRDGTPAERAAAAKVLEASAAATAASDTPTALNSKDWSGYGKNYADRQTTAGRTDVQAPMTFEGLQPGMQGDQIGRFRKADGSVHFANAGAVRNVTPAPVITPTASTSSRDTGLRSAPAPIPAVTPTSTPAINTPTEASGINRAGWNALANKVFKGTNWTDASLGAGMTRDTGEDPTFASAAPVPIRQKIERPISISPGTGTKGLGLNFAPDLTPQYPTNPGSTSPVLDLPPDEPSILGYANRLDAGKSGPGMPRIAAGAAAWLKDLNKRKKSTNPLFPNYEQ